MKPRLIKFTCPACNARLAVPEAMAGVEDNCPKCGEKIEAPSPAPATPAVTELPPGPAAAPALAPAMSGHQSHGILDAVLHAPEIAKKAPATSNTPVGVSQPEERKAFRETLFDEFLSAPLPSSKEAVTREPDAPAPPARAAEPTPVSDAAPDAKPAPLKKVQPVREPGLKAPVMAAPAVIEPVEMPPVEASAPQTLLEKITSTDPGPATQAEASTRSTAPPSAFDTGAPVPGQGESAPETESEFGMGDMIAELSSSQSPSITRHVVPSLGVGLMQVEDTPRHQRRLRRRRATVTGILIFLAFDAAVVCWIFRHRISEWWQERHSSAAAQASSTTATLHGTETPPTSSKPGPVQPAANKADPGGKSPATLASAIPGERPGDMDLTVIPPPPAQRLDNSMLVALPLAPPPAITLTAPLQTGPVVSQPPSSPVVASLASQPPVIPKAGATADLPEKMEAPKEIPAVTEPLMAKTDVPPPPPPPPLPAGVSLQETPEKPAASLPPPAGTAAATIAADAPPESTTPSGSATKIVEKGVTSASLPAITALKNFLTAPNWQERLRWVQKPDSVKSAMEKHYRKYPDGPVNVGQIEFIERYPARGGNPPYSMIEVQGGVLKHTVLVLVEEKNKADPRVDWEAFVEFKDQLLWEFLIKPGSPPQKFRVMLRRKHYFDKNVPDIDRKDAFELSQPGADTLANVFAVKGGLAARLLTPQVSWGDSIAVMVELAWRGMGDRAWVEVKSVPAFGWRG